MFLCDSSNFIDIGFTNHNSPSCENVLLEQVFASSMSDEYIGELKPLLFEKCDFNTTCKTTYFDEEISPITFGKGNHILRVEKTDVVEPYLVSIVVDGKIYKRPND